MATQFSDRQLHVGSLYGLRAFVVSGSGWLCGVNYHYPWQPGENVAECHRGSTSEYWRRVMSDLVRAGAAEWIPPDHGQTEVPHELVALDCTCGYYAYYDGSNDHLSQVGWTLRPESGPRVAGIIEGYGRVVAGTRGFRAEKARLRAVVLPGVARHHSGAKAVLRNYPDLPAFRTADLALAEFPLTDYSEVPA